MEEAGACGEATDRRMVLRARSGLALFLLATIACLLVAPARAPDVSRGSASGDFHFYRSVVERVRNGEPYYDAAHRELTSQGYPSRSVLNWRTPCYAWLLGKGPGPVWGRGILLVGMIAAGIAWTRDLRKDFGLVPATVGGVFLGGAVAWCVGPDGVYLMEFWAAMLIALSVCAYRRGWIAVGVGLGLLAIFYRELALPYAVVSAGIAVRQGRRRELAAWAIGFLIFAVFMGYHAYQVRARINGDDLGMPAGWVRFGGLGFLLETARTNVFLMPLPLWWTALYLPLATVGLLGGRGEPGWRVGLTAGLFLAAFSVVGNPFNFYWGFLNAPLLAVGIAGAPRILSRWVSIGLVLPFRPNRIPRVVTTT